MSTEIFKDNFQKHLDEFSRAIKDYRPIDEIKPILNKLKEDVGNDEELTYRQKLAITGRCDNYLAGQYGEQVKRVDARSDYSKSLK